MSGSLKPPKQDVLVGPLIRQLDPTCHTWEFTCCKEDRRSCMTALDFLKDHTEELVYMDR